MTFSPLSNWVARITREDFTSFDLPIVGVEYDEHERFGATLVINSDGKVARLTDVQQRTAGSKTTIFDNTPRSEY